MMINKAIFKLTGGALLALLFTGGCAEIGLDLKWPWDEPSPENTVPNEPFYDENLPLPLSRTSQGYYVAEVTIGQGTYKFLIDTGLSALVIFEDRVNPADYAFTGPALDIAALNQTISGFLGTANLEIAGYKSNGLKVMLSTSFTYADENGQLYEGIDGILGLRYKRSPQFSTSVQVPDVPMAAISPGLNLYELNLDPSGDSAHLGLGIAPITRSAKFDYMFISTVQGVTDSVDPGKNSFTDLEPDASIINSSGDAFDTTLLLSTGLKDKFILDEELAVELGYNRASQTWNSPPALDVYIKGKYNNLKMPLEFKTDDIQVEVLSGSSDTTGYKSVVIDSVAVNVFDDDENPSVQLITQSAPSTVMENSSADYSYTLDKAPDGGVLLYFYAVGNPAYVEFSTDNCVTTDQHALVYFDPFNYNQLQSFSACPVDDAALGDKTFDLEYYVVGTDTQGYTDLVPVPQTVTILDDDSKNLVISETSVTIGETGTGKEINLRLTSPPDSGDVVVDITSSDATEVKVSPDTCDITASQQTSIQLSLNASNYEFGLVYYLCPQNDDDDDGDQAVSVDLAVNIGGTTDTDYQGASGVNVSLVVNDDDESEIAVSESRAVIKEGGEGTVITYTAGAKPTANVDISFTSADTDEYVFGNPDCDTTSAAATLTFTSADYIPKDLVICPVDDAAADSHQTIALTPSVSTTDTNYNTTYPSALLPDLEIYVIDTAAPYILTAQTAVTVDEDSQPYTTAVLLNSVPSPDGGITPAILEPDGTIIVDYTSDAPGELLLSLDSCQTSTETVTVMFDTNNFGDAVNLDLCPQTDGVNDGNTMAFVTGAVNTDLSTDTTGFTLVTPATLVVTVNDIDPPVSVLPPGVTISETSAGIIEGNNASITVSLDAEPDGTVIVDGTSTNGDRLALSQTGCTDSTSTSTRLVFTTINWNQDRTVYLCALNNADVDGDAVASVDFTVDATGKNTDYKAAIGLSAWQKYIVGFDYTDYQGGGPQGTVFFLDRDEPYETAEYFSYLPETNPNLIELDGLNTIADEQYPDISDDGQTIVFQSERPGGMGGNDIFIYRRGEGLITVPGLNSSADDASPTISGDGKIIMFHSNRAGGEGGYDLYICYLDDFGSFVDKVFEVNTAADEMDPDISSDGDYFAFRSARSGAEMPVDGGGNDIFVYNWFPSNGYKEYTGLNSVNEELAPSIAKNGSLIAFDGRYRSDNLGDFDVYLYDSPDGNLTELSPNVNSAERDGSISVSSDGGFLAFETSRANAEYGSVGRDIMLYEIASGENIFLPGLNSHFEDSAPALSSQAKYIIFHSKRPGAVGGYDIYLYQHD